MKLVEIVPEDSIVLELASKNKVEVLRELVAALRDSNVELDIEEVVRVLVEREKLGSTGIGEGVAIPHGKVDGIKRVVGAFGRSSKGIDFDSLDGTPVKLFFLLLAPTDSTGSHLKALAKASKMLKSQPLRDRLLQASDREEVIRVMKEIDETG